MISQFEPLFLIVECARWWQYSNTSWQWHAVIQVSIQCVPYWFFLLTFFFLQQVTYQKYGVYLLHVTTPIFQVQCDEWGAWVHCVCAGVKVPVAQLRALHYACPRCIRNALPEKAVFTCPPKGRAQVCAGCDHPLNHMVTIKIDDVYVKEVFIPKRIRTKRMVRKLSFHPTLGCLRRRTIWFTDGQTVLFIKEQLCIEGFTDDTRQDTVAPLGLLGYME